VDLDRVAIVDGDDGRRFVGERSARERL